MLRAVRFPHRPSLKVSWSVRLEVSPLAADQCCAVFGWPHQCTRNMPLAVRWTLINVRFNVAFDTMASFACHVSACAMVSKQGRIVCGAGLSDLPQ